MTARSRYTRKQVIELLELWFTVYNERAKEVRDEDEETRQDDLAWYEGRADGLAGLIEYLKKEA